MAGVWRGTPGNTGWMDIDIRWLRDDDIDGLVLVDSMAFSAEPDLAATAARVRDHFETDRIAVAEDAGRLVGNAGAFSLRLTLPAGQVPVAAVTWVAVAPTHRRRGVMRALMERIVQQAREREESVAALYASQGPIYGNVGYGPATFERGVSIDTRGLTFRAPPREGIGVRIASTDELGSLLEPLMDAAVRRRVGEISLNPGLAALRIEDWSGRSSPKPAYVLVAEERGEPVGLAVYRTSERWDDGFPAHEVTVELLAGAHDDACLELWRTLCSLDLVSTIRTRAISPDDPLRWHLDDPRALRTTVLNDGLWVRLIDIGAFFTARGVATDDRLVVDVGPAGTWELDADGCRTSGREPDLELGPVELAALSLGGHRSTPLARAGRIVERTPGARGRLDALLAVDPEPYCLIHF